MEQHIIKIKDLNVSYVTDDGTYYAVNDLNLDIRRGETLGLVGETGAGKTTTALSILRLLPDRVGRIDSGEIFFDDVAIHEASEAQMRLLRGERISMIFQDPMTSLNPVLTIGDQIAEVLESHSRFRGSRTDIQARVDEMMQKVGLPPERKNEYPHQFSGGMKQRVVIAIALACEPELLLADEPTTALDVTIQAQVLDLMQDLQQEFGTSMMLITHDLGVVAETCDRVAIMYAGEIIESGDVNDIFYGADHHPYTIGLFGSIPSMSEGQKRLQPIDGLMPDPSVQIVGCPFYDRCPKRFELCEKRKPQRHYRGEHMIKCHLFDSNERSAK